MGGITSPHLVLHPYSTQCACLIHGVSPSTRCRYSSRWYTSSAWCITPLMLCHLLLGVRYQVEGMLDYYGWYEILDIYYYISTSTWCMSPNGWYYLLIWYHIPLLHHVRVQNRVQDILLHTSTPCIRDMTPDGYHDIQQWYHFCQWTSTPCQQGSLSSLVLHHSGGVPVQRVHSIHYYTSTIQRYTPHVQTTDGMVADLQMVWYISCLVLDVREQDGRGLPLLQQYLCNTPDGVYHSSHRY